MYSQKSIHLYIAGLVALIAIGTHVALAFMLERGSAKLVLKREEVLNGEQDAGRLRHIEELYESTQSGTIALDSRFADANSNVEIIEALERFGRTHSVEVTIEKADIEKTATGTLDIMHVNLNLVGAWRNIIGFVDSFDTFAYAHRIDTLNFNGNATDDPKAPKGVWRANFDVHIPLKK